MLLAGAIASTWLLSLISSLSWSLSKSSAVAIAIWLLFRTFLHTGLFVIAHDAMHGNILPHHPVVNRWVGRCALWLYGFLPYDICRKQHWQHHKYPAQERDPDFYPPSDDNLMAYLIRWYCYFLSSYLTPQTLVSVVVGIVIIIVSLVFLFGVAVQNLILFWVIPWVLSSIQLFTFGIFLPHHFEDDGNVPHQSRSYYYPLFWSLLACYHFSYHQEHHAYPNVPWYQLPYVRPVCLSLL